MTTDKLISRKAVADILLAEYRRWRAIDTSTASDVNSGMAMGGTGAIANAISAISKLPVESSTGKDGEE